MNLDFEMWFLHLFTLANWHNATNVWWGVKW